MTSDADLEVLEAIYQTKTEIHQRDIAEHSGLSLGMTNMVIKRLVKRGLLAVRKLNNRNIHYLVTPHGVEAIVKRSYRYLKKTLENVGHYRTQIEEVVSQIVRDGYQQVRLIGPSDLDFIIEYCVHAAGLVFVRDGEEKAGQFTIYGENVALEDIVVDVSRKSLRDLLLEESRHIVSR